jgi:hypothetical protein
MPFKAQRIVDFTLAGVWLIMGLYCKVLGQVPRHEAIVADILGTERAVWLTPLIGIGECFLAIWIATGLYRKTSAGLQILLVLVMNVLEFTLAVDHLLWGPMNVIFALLFCALVYWNGFILKSKSHVEPN